MDTQGDLDATGIARPASREPSFRSPANYLWTAARAHDGSELRQIFVVNGGIKHILRDAAAGGTACLDSFAILALRIALRSVLAENAAVLGVSVVAAGEALLVLAVAMLATARLELWLRARRMLAEAQAASGPPKIVS